MRTFYSFLLVLLLVDGVFGVEKANVTVSVMEGDSVTLNPSTEIPKDDTVEWWFGGEQIARMNKAAGIFSTSDVTDGRFRDRLKLDKQTGSLTITNITTEHTGLYELKIKTRTVISLIFSVTVRDVVESVSVMEGDSVTLHTGVTDIQRDDQIVWKFKDEVLRTDGLNGWSKLNDQTGGITIRNIRRDQSGDYKMEINTRRLILHRKLRLNISGETTVSVMEGEPVILYTGLFEIQGYDLILWKFGDHLIAEINKVANRFLPHDSSDGGRFKGRLQMHRQYGDLTVRGSRTTDSGDYHLHMNSSSHTLQRSISVTVSVPDKPTPDRGLSSESTGWKVTAIVLIVILIMILIILGIRRYNKGSWPCRRHADDST